MNFSRSSGTCFLGSLTPSKCLIRRDGLEIGPMRREQRNGHELTPGSGSA